MEPIKMIGQAHLDVTWLWRWQEGYMEVLSTFRSALDRIAETNEFIFTCSSALYYQFVEENDPAMFREIQAAVKAERWRIVGGWWVQPDTHLPSGETFARHALYAQRYYKEKFGITCKTGYCVDSFGQSAGLPQLLKFGGMENYIFMRPNLGENSDIPTLFNWKSAEGSEIMTYRITGQHYCNYAVTDDYHTVAEVARETGLPVMCFYGVGNHGGGPTRKNIEEILTLRAEGEAVEFSDPDAYFKRVRELNPSLPVWDKELLRHAVGCYSVGAHIKTAFRKCEIALTQAEKADTAVSVLLSTEPERKELARGWKNILFNSFHDIAAGTSIRSAYTDALDLFGEARAISDRIKNKALAKIARNINTMIDGHTNEGKTHWQLWEDNDNGVPLVLYNSLPWEMNVPVTLPKKLSSVCGPDGTALPVQYIKGEEINGEHHEATVFMAVLPPFGYSTYWGYLNRILHQSSATSELDNKYILENEKIRVHFDKNSGYINSIFNKIEEREVLSAPSFVPEIYNDVDYDTWAHNQTRFNDLIAKMRAVSIQVIERGPVRSTMRVKFAYQHSQVLAEYHLYEGSELLTVRIKSLWQEKHTILKFAINSNLQSPLVRAQVPYGTVTRDVDGEEFPMQAWVDMQDSEYGLAVLNDCKYSYDAQGSTIRITALRNSIYADHVGVRVDGEEYDFIEDGLHGFTLTLMPHKASESCAEIHRLAATLNSPPDLLIDSYHEGELPREQSFVKATDGVDVTAFKTQEDGKGYILRCYEIGMVGCKAVIEVPLLNVTIRASFKPNEIKTFQINNGQVSEVDFCEWLV